MTTEEELADGVDSIDALDDALRNGSLEDARSLIAHVRKDKMILRDYAAKLLLATKKPIDVSRVIDSRD